MSVRSSLSGVVERLENRQFLSTAAPVSAPLATDPGADVATAVDLGNFNKIKSTQADTIGAGDTVDYFKFTVTQPTSFSAKVKGAGKTAKLVKPTVTLFNTSNTAAPSKTTTAAKQTLGAGTYYVVVNGQETGTTDYKLTLTTKQYKGKKAPTFVSTPEDTGDGGDDGQNGGGSAITGNLTADPGGNFSDTYLFTATQTGTFELPATFASDVFWNCAPENAPNSSGVGGTGVGPGDGTLSVIVEAGLNYVFNLVSGGTATSYSVTMDASFSNVRLAQGG